MRPWGGGLGRIQALTTVAGAALIGFGWWGASGSARPAGQLNWLSVAAAGMVLAAIGHGLFLVDAQRRVTVRRLAVVGRSPRGAPEALPAPACAAPPEVRVAVARGRRYHRPDCHLVAGKATTILAPVRVAGLLPCEVCRP